MNRILVVDTNQDYAHQIEEQLTIKGKRKVTIKGNAIEAIAEYVRAVYDLIIVDYDIPEIDGITVIRTIQRINPFVKTVLLDKSSRYDVELQAVGKKVSLYFDKHKNLELLEGYVNIMSREFEASYANEAQLMSIEDKVVVDTMTRVVYKEGAPVNLTRKEYEILLMLLKNKGSVISREKMLERVWSNTKEETSVRVVDGYVKRLRKKLDLFQLSSVRGIGYIWN